MTECGIFLQDYIDTFFIFFGVHTMMKKSLSLSAVLLLSSVMNVNAEAVGLDIKVVSAQDLMMTADSAKEASAKIEKQRQDYSVDLQKRAEDLQKREKDLQTKSSTMSQESIRKESMEIANLKQDLENDQKKLMQQLQADAQVEMEKLSKEFDKAVQKVAKDTKADLILEKETGRIVFANEKLNITDSVKVAMNDAHKTTQVASAKKDKVTA